MSVWCWFYLQVTTMVYTFNCDMCNYRSETATNAKIYLSHVTLTFSHAMLSASRNCREKNLYNLNTLLLFKYNGFFAFLSVDLFSETDHVRMKQIAWEKRYWIMLLIFIRMVSCIKT